MRALRFERHIGSLEAQSAPAGDFVPARSYAAQSRVIDWKNVVPRLSVAFDVTGARRTVLKGSVSEFTQRQGSQLIDQFNPLRQNTEVRTWTDANGDLVPQLERDRSGTGCARSRRHRSASLPGLGRPTQWEATASVEHQLADDFAVTLSYFHRRYQDLTAVVNVAVTPDDYTPLADHQPARRNAADDLQPERRDASARSTTS